MMATSLLSPFRLYNIHVRKEKKTEIGWVARGYLRSQWALSELIIGRSSPATTWEAEKPATNYHTSIMDFGWGCLGKEKNKEEVCSKEDRNLKHRRRSWSEVVAWSPKKGQENNSTPSLTVLSSMMTKPVEWNASEEEELALLATARWIGKDTTEGKDW